MQWRNRDRVHYFSGQKNAHYGEAIAAGFQCRKVPIESMRLEPDALHFTGGLQFGGLELMQALLENGEEYIFFDRAYFGGGPRTNRIRAVPMAYQHSWLQPAYGPRAFGVELKDWRKSGEYLMLVPPGPAICQLFGLGNWAANITREIIKITDRPMYVSYKGDSKPLAERLGRCHAVITWTSNVAVEAVCAGVPVFVSPFSAALPVGNAISTMTAESLESPNMSADRQAWVDGLAWGQFSLEEIASGFAREVLETNWAGATTS